MVSVQAVEKQMNSLIYDDDGNILGPRSYLRFNLC